MSQEKGRAVIGFYDYTVVLTYISLVSAVLGCIVATGDNGHPYIGGFFLLLSGLCDAFDGKVARSKPNRTSRARAFGAHIDSLSDLIAFGVLPAMIAVGFLKSHDLPFTLEPDGWGTALTLIVFVLILAFYVLTALIRLAYFNVLEEEQRHDGAEEVKEYIGMPVTMAALIFPFILMLNYILPAYLGSVYLGAMVVTGFLFIGNFRIKKSGEWVRLLLIGVGTLEFILLLVSILLRG